MPKEPKYKIVENKWIGSSGELLTDYTLFKKGLILWEYISSKNTVRELQKEMEKHKQRYMLKKETGRRRLTNEEIFKELL